MRPRSLCGSDCIELRRRSNVSCVSSTSSLESSCFRLSIDDVCSLLRSSDPSYFAKIERSVLLPQSDN